MALEVSWTLREPPLTATAAVARGAAARRLAERLARLDDGALARLVGVAGDELVVVSGEDLPWVDGVTYVGVDPSAPRLLLPTTRVPTVHPSLVEAALLERTKAAPPLVVLDDLLIISFANARALQRARLVQWIAAREERAP